MEAGGGTEIPALGGTRHDGRGRGRGRRAASDATAATAATDADEPTLGRDRAGSGAPAAEGTASGSRRPRRMGGSSPLTTGGCYVRSVTSRVNQPRLWLSYTAPAVAVAVAREGA